MNQDTFRKSDIQTLMESADDVCISAYMPIVRKGTESKQNPIRFKNMLQTVEAELAAWGKSPQEIENLLSPAYRLQKDHMYWNLRSAGLAVFLSPEIFRTYHLPVNFSSYTTVAPRFHFKPLMGYLTGNIRFYILAASGDDARVYRADRRQIREIEVEGLPRGMHDILKYDDPQKQLQFHTGAKDSAGDRPAVFHGHGVGSDESKDHLTRYFREIRKALEPVVTESPAPVVFAGVESMFGTLRETGGLPRLMDRYIPGNPDEVSPESLHEKGWEAVSQIPEAAMEKAADTYAEKKGSDLASADLRQVVPAAYFGRVDTVFMNEDAVQWGRFDPDSGAVTLHSEKTPGDVDLVDFIATCTLLGGGTVYPVTAGKLPDSGVTAAVFRYPRR
jgi:hypothetical protein